MRRFEYDVNATVTLQGGLPRAEIDQIVKMFQGSAPISSSGSTPTQDQNGADIGGSFGELKQVNLGYQAQDGTDIIQAVSVIDSYNFTAAAEAVPGVFLQDADEIGLLDLRTVNMAWTFQVQFQK